MKVSIILESCTTNVKSSIIVILLFIKGIDINRFILRNLRRCIRLNFQER